MFSRLDFRLVPDYRLHRTFDITLGCPDVPVTSNQPILKGVPSMCQSHHAVCFILPPHIESKLAENPKYRDRALRALQISERQRGLRQGAPILALIGQAGPKHRTIFDAQDGSRPEDVAIASKASVYDLTMHLHANLPRRVL